MERIPIYQHFLKVCYYMYTHTERTPTIPHIPPIEVYFWHLKSEPPTPTRAPDKQFIKMQYYLNYYIRDTCLLNFRGRGRGFLLHRWTFWRPRRRRGSPTRRAAHLWACTKSGRGCVREYTRIHQYIHIYIYIYVYTYSFIDLYTHTCIHIWETWLLSDDWSAPA